MQFFFKHLLTLSKKKASILADSNIGKSFSVGAIGDNAFASIIVVGASGDLAKKKTFPSLFALFGLGKYRHQLSLRIHF